jgi:AcrR family transcriptional regulator
MARPSDSRRRLLAAGAVEFAAHGFDGAVVDRIAARARVNKAMVYYHFGSKAGLYRTLLSDMFQTTGVRAWDIAARQGDPMTKLDAFIATLARELLARPHIPRMMLREISDGGRRIDAEVQKSASAIREALAAILREGAQAGVFRPDVHPFLVHMTIIGPLLIHAVAAAVRAPARLLSPDEAAVISSHDAVVDHIVATVRSAVVASPREIPS